MWYEFNPVLQFAPHLLNLYVKKLLWKVVNELLNANCFDFPKSVYLIEDVIKLCCPRNGLVIDFFSGSGTTAHATMLANAHDKGIRRFVVNQIAASCDEKSPAFKEGYKNICEIGKERMI